MLLLLLAGRLVCPLAHRPEASLYHHLLLLLLLIAAVLQRDSKALLTQQQQQQPRVMAAVVRQCMHKGYQQHMSGQQVWRVPLG
jgi:hypothetical protein